MPDVPRRMILCVDDEQDVVDALFDTFMDDYDVKVATSGKEALKIFDEEDISLVISDQRMPEMEGTELLARINDIKPICKKILLTGYADINAAIDAINQGSVDKYFSKPWDDDELTGAVGKLLVDYKTDEFLARVMNDVKGMKAAAGKPGESPETLKQFLESHLSGICVVGDGGKIEYLNTIGLKLLRHEDSGAVTGKGFEEIFLLNEINTGAFREKYEGRDPSPHRLEVKLGDGSQARMEASLTFRTGEDGVQVSGIIFNAS